MARVYFSFVHINNRKIISTGIIRINGCTTANGIVAESSKLTVLNRFCGGCAIFLCFKLVIQHM